MMDDHGLTDSEAAELFRKQNSIRKRKCLSILHDQIEIKKIKVRNSAKKYNFLYENDRIFEFFFPPFLGNCILQQTFGGIC